jgi:hypothetical protein
VVVVTAAIVVAMLQSSGEPAIVPGTVPTPSANRVMAVRSARPIAIDGKDGDDVWRTAGLIDGFFEFDPVQGKAPRFRTEAKVAYDNRNIYVFVRMFDPEPGRILRQLGRRDVRTAGDQIKVVLDSYHDRRSGYEFAVNPAGVKRDYSIYDDWREDDAWDGVWDVATTVDSAGWTAEFRIPLSQLRYTNADSHTFGIGIWRDIDRFQERVSWPLYRKTEPGLASQLGELVGLVGLPSPRRLEASPYVVTKNVTLPRDQGGFTHPERLTGGIDFKYGISSNLTLDGTVNPDFGQVEADPAVLNLSAFETFFQERRPFFMEGNGLLSFRINCYAVRDCGSENLFYSRRIGRTPQFAASYGDASSPTGTTILGAAKITGRTPSGLSIGAIEAVTGREEGTLGRTIEPRTNYSVFRATRDFHGGQSGIGVIGTMVNRSLDSWTDSLRSDALVGGVDFRHRFAKGRFQVDGRIVGSRIGGSPTAVSATQESSVHYYQRPDGDLRYDPTRTSLTGHSAEVNFGKVGGERVRFETSYQRVSPGFEANDLGFLRRADWQSQATWFSLNWNRPSLFFRQLFWNFNEEQQWTTAGLPLDRSLNTNVHFALRSNWWIHAGMSVGGLGAVYCDRCARGGPALRTDRGYGPWFGVQGDGRLVVVPSVWFNYWRTDGGRSRSVWLSPAVSFRVSSRLTSAFGVDFGWNRDDRQWYGNFTDSVGASHYTFAHLEQRTASLTARVNFTATPTVTVQLYLQPFVSKGQYTDVRELASPRAALYQDRLQPYGDSAVRDDPGGFNYKQFRSNLVLRWEYRSGSALFVVWQQGRADSEDQYSGRSLGADFRQLMRTHPDNTILIKLSYWFDR